MVHEDFNQISVNPAVGVTFGSILRNILRQDPDVILVGEIRDHETAEIARKEVVKVLKANKVPEGVCSIINGNYKVGEYMTTDIAQVRPEADLDEIQEKIIENKQLSEEVFKRVSILDCKFEKINLHTCITCFVFVLSKSYYQRHAEFCQG